MCFSKVYQKKFLKTKEDFLLHHTYYHSRISFHCESEWTIYAIQVINLTVKIKINKKSQSLIFFVSFCIKFTEMEIELQQHVVEIMRKYAEMNIYGQWVANLWDQSLFIKFLDQKIFENFAGKLLQVLNSNQKILVKGFVFCVDL